MAGYGVVGAGPHFEASNAGFTGSGVPAGGTQTVEVDMGGVVDTTFATPAQPSQNAGDAKDTPMEDAQQAPQGAPTGTSAAVTPPQPPAATQPREMPVVWTINARGRPVSQGVAPRGNELDCKNPSAILTAWTAKIGSCTTVILDRTRGQQGPVPWRNTVVQSNVEECYWRLRWILDVDGSTTNSWVLRAGAPETLALIEKFDALAAATFRPLRALGAAKEKVPRWYWQLKDQLGQCLAKFNTLREGNERFGG